MAWEPAGLVCAPRAGAGVTAADVARLPVPVDVLPAVPAWPAPPSGWVAGWYHRTPAHAAAPPGVREIVVAAGDAFGAVPHATTGLCLAALDALPPAPAWDLGCGAGVLTQAWAALHGMPIDAVDIDVAAARQASAGAEAAGLDAVVRVHTAPAERLAPDVTGRVVVANLPPVAHRAVAPHVSGAPAACVVSGFRDADTGDVCGLYAHLGVRPVAVTRAGAWACAVLTPPPR